MKQYMVGTTINLHISAIVKAKSPDDAIDKYEALVLKDLMEYETDNLFVGLTNDDFEDVKYNISIVDD